MAIILIVLFVFLFSLWFLGFYKANDFSLPTRKLDGKTKKVLVIFPHADDEVLTTGGLMRWLSRHGRSVSWIVLTRGERGNEGAGYDESLKKTRTHEAKCAARYYGANLIQMDFPDNDVAVHKDKLKKELERALAKLSPDLVITYDLSGLYGHPDHIVASQVVSALIKSKFHKTNLWYATFPRKVLKTLKLPEHMAKDPSFKKSRSYPDFKIGFGLRGVICKICSLYCYKSQLKTYKKGFPYKFLPLWVYVLFMPYEYFYDAST